MSERIWRVARSYIPPSQVVATTLIRLFVAGGCYAASRWLPETLSSVAVFFMHIGLLMALFGLIAHLEATFVRHVFSAVELARFWVRTMVATPPS